MSNDFPLCINCGAPVEAPSPAGFATCGKCGSALAIVRSEGGVTTVLVEKDAEQMEQVPEFKYWAELHQMDKRWQEERESHLIVEPTEIPDEYIRRQPSRRRGILYVAAGIALGLAFCAAATLTDKREGFGMAIIVALLGIGLGSIEITKARKLQQARNEYGERKRDARHRFESGDSEKPGEQSAEK